MKRNFLLVLSFFFLNSTIVFSQQWIWGNDGKLISGHFNSTGWTMSIANDNKGNSFITGYFTGEVGFDNYKLVNDSFAEEAYLTKFDSYGNILWAKQSKNNDTSFFCSSNAVTTDKRGNIYITGFFTNNTAFGPYYLYNPPYSSAQVFLVKYNESGNVIWARQSYYSTVNGLGLGTGIATDEEGNIYITGNCSDTVVFETDTLKYGSEFLVKYDSNGNVKWAKHAVSINYFSPTVSTTSATTDLSGNIYITGYFQDSAKFDTALIYTKTNNDQVFIVKYNSNGNVVWARQSFGVEGKGYSIVADRYDNIYVSGSFVDTLVFNMDTIIGHGVFLAKYDSNGTLKWVRDGNGIDTEEVWNSTGVSVDTMNTVYFSCYEGRANSPTKNRIVFGHDTFKISSSLQDEPTVIIKFDSGGKLVCGSIINGGSAGGGSPGITSDYSGNNIIYGGNLYSTQIFGADTLQLPGAITPFVARWLGCNSDSIEPSISNRLPICKGNCNDSLTESPIGGSLPYTYQWSTSPPQTTQTASSLCSGSYYVIITDSLGNKTYQTGIISQIPNHLTINPSIDSICKGSSLTLTSSGTKTYSWSPASSLSCDTCPTTVAAPTVTLTYTITGIDSSGCTDTNYSHIKVKPKPTGSITGNYSVCLGISTILTASGGNSFLWNTGGTYDTTSVSLSKDTSFSVIVILNGCSDTVYKNLIVNQVPALAVCCDTSIAADQSVQLNATGSGTFSWVPGLGLSCYDCPNPIASPLITTTYTITLTSDSGCINKQELTIDVVPCEVFIPNAFSPNNDGHNDILYVHSECINDIDFIIFDRWGNKVFESQNLDYGWDGTYKGRPMDAGTYMYYLKATMSYGTSFERKGSLALVR